MAFDNDNIQHEQSSTKKIRLDPEVARDENKIPTEHSTPVEAVQEQTVEPIQSEEKRVKDKAVLECVNENIFEHMFLRRIVRENHGVSILKTQFNFVKLSKACAETSNNVQALGESPDMAEVIESESDPTCEMDSDSAMDTDIDVKAKDESRVVELDADERYRHTAVKKDPHDTSNILITLSPTQANIYDNEHCGDHLDIMSNYQVDSGLEIVCGGWVSTRNDAVFAVGLANGQIRIVSLAWSKELSIIQAHEGRISDLIQHPTIDGIILTISEDKTMKLWSVHNESYISCYKYCATAVCFTEDGRSIVTGSKSGEICTWPVIEPEVLAGISKNKNIFEPVLFEADSCTKIVPGKKLYNSLIDCIACYKNYIIFRNIGGRIEVYDNLTSKIIGSFNVPNNEENSCNFDVSSDGNYICTGNASGAIFIFNVNTGKVINKLHHKRSVRPITCCTFSKDSKSIIYGSDSSLLWRYDYIDAKRRMKWESFIKA